jgi:O-antigen ligase
MYLARVRRCAPLFVGLSLVFYGVACLTGTRSAMLFGALALLFGLVLNCVNGQNRKQHRLIALVLLLAAFAALIYVNRHTRSFAELWDRLLEFLRLEVLGDFDLLDEWIADKNDSVGSRLKLLREGWNDFKSAPIFGVGFRDGSLDPDAEMIGVLNHMYHNLPLQFLGSMGAFGFAALVWHVVDLGRAIFKQRSINKALLLALPLLILGSSMLDNFFFFLNFQIIYCAMLALSEHCAPPDELDGRER